MRVFVTGASGFVGSAVVKELLGAGHRVVGLARSDAAAKSIASVGAEVLKGGLEDLESLRRGAAESEGVVHTAFIHDYAKMAASAATDKLAIETIGGALAGSGRPFVVTSAIGLLTPGRVGTEADAPASNSAGSHRVASEEAALSLASKGVRVSLVRLPSSVHGEGDHGFVPGLIRIAREKGLSAYVGEGNNRWPAVHRLDAAAVYRLALEKGLAGTRYHAVADEGVPTREIAGVIGRHLDLPVLSKSPEEAPAHFTWLARFFSSDIAASSLRTRDALGWAPSHPSLLADLELGHYFRP